MPRGRRLASAALVVTLVGGCTLSTVSRSAAGPGDPPSPTAAALAPGISPNTPDPTDAADTPAEADVEPWRWAPLHEPGVGGRVTDVAIDPRDPDRLLVGGDLIGVGVSRDGGETWLGTEGLTNPEIGRFTFHPARADEVWVATMGGPFLSRDGGSTWQERRTGFPALAAEYYSAPVEEVLVDPADPDHLLAIGGSHREWTTTGDPAWGAVWESRDNGGQWARTSTVAGGTNLVDGIWLSDGVLLVAALGQGVWRSADGGLTWAPASVGLPADVRALASHPSRPTTIWAAVGSQAGEDLVSPGGVWRSDDSGLTWYPTSVGLDAGASVEDSAAHTANYRVIAVAPADPAVLMTSSTAFGGEAVFRSADGGATWSKVLDDGGFGRPVTAYSTPIGAEAIAIDPTDPARVVLGNAEYVLATTDAGATWDDLTSDLRADGTFSGRGYSGLVANRVALHPEDPDTVVLCAFDGGNPLVSVDGGQGWRKPLAAWDRWGGCHDVSPVPSGAATPAGPSSAGSADGDGGWWVLLGQAGTFNGVAWFHTQSGRWKGFAGGDLPDRYDYVGDLGAIEALVTTDGTLVVLVALGGALLRSTDSGASWQDVSGLAGVTDLQSDPAQPGVVHLAAADGVWWSADGGASFSRSAGSPSGATRLALTGGSLYAVGFRQGDTGLHRLTASGQWELLLADPLVADVAADPEDPGHLVAVTNDHPYHDRVSSTGVLRSLDGGASWAPDAGGLPVTRVSAVAFDPATPGRLIVGTFGRGYYAAT